MNRKELGEPAFGEKLAPILKEIETAIWNHNANFEGERPLYPDEAMRAAACIFSDVLLDRMYEEQERNNIPQEQRGLQAQNAGAVIYQTIYKFTGLDTRELMQRLIEEMRANTGAKEGNK